MNEFEGFAKIYALTDDQDRPFYVGCTIKELEERRIAHIYDAMKGQSWRNLVKVKKISSLKFKPGIKLLESMPVCGKNGKEAQLKAIDRERFWIKKLISEGHELCNRVHGNLVWKREKR